MRFCMVTTFYPPYHYGGDATHVRALSRALVNAGHEVEVLHCVDAFMLRRRGPTADNAPDDGIVVHPLRSRFGALSPLISQQTGHPGLKSAAIRAVLSRNFDVVHFHNLSLIGGPEVVQWSRASVTLCTLLEYWLICPTHVLWKNRERVCDSKTCVSCCVRSGIPPQLWRYAGKGMRSVKAADALLAPSQYTARLHREAGFTIPIRILPLFSPLAPVGVSATREPDAPFMFAGRVTAAKGIIPLLELFATLPEHRLLVAGEGELRPELEKRFAAHPNIRFLSGLRQSDLAAVYARAAALIMPSLAPETHGLCITEAAAFATPAIVRGACGAREQVERTGGGIVFNTDGELRSAILRLASDQDLRERLGTQAREGFLRYYTAGSYLQTYLRLIDDVQAKRHAA